MTHYPKGALWIGTGLLLPGCRYTESTVRPILR